VRHVPEIITELERLAKVAQGLQQRYIAHFALHAAACVNNDRAEMTQRRDELHTILDSLLDNGESIERLSVELVSATRPS
jgi:hypothetical protein